MPRWPLGVAPVLQAWPVVGTPPVDRLAIGLAGNPLWFLRGDVAVCEPGVQVSGIELYAPLALDYLSDATSGPEIGRETEGPRTLAEPREYETLLSRVEFGGSPALRLGFESGIAAFAVSCEPFEDGANVDIEEVGDFLGRVTLVEAFDRKESSPFEFGRRAGCSHAK